MSKDLTLVHVCPHRVVREWLVLGEDQQTLRTRQPLSNQRVTLWRNGILVPPMGVFSPLEISSNIPQPFNLETPSTFRFRINEQDVQEVNLPSGRRVGADLIVQAIQEQSSGLVVSNERGFIVLRVRNDSSRNVIFLDGGTGHEAIGFPFRRSFRNQMIVPSWAIVKDERRALDPTARLIRFDEQLKTEDDIFEVSYSTVRTVCRRCNGLGIENDLRHDNAGKPLFSRNQSLLLQEVQKIIFTIKGSNLFHQWYGTSLIGMVGQKITRDRSFIEARLTKEISDALEKYQQVKDQQALYQPVDDRELLQRVVSLEVQQAPQDPTTFFIDIVLESRSGDLEQLTDSMIITDTAFARNFQRIR
jgi:hypothetical protein